MKLCNVLLLFILAAGAHAASPDARFRQLQSDIDHASERGRIEEARSLRSRLARESADAGYYLEAARQYELLLASRPSKKERVRLFTELGRLRETTGDWAGALASYDDARHDDPKAWDATLAKGRVSAHLRDYRGAEEAYRFCRKLRPGAIEPLNGLASVYLERGYFKDAVKTYEEALELYPTPQAYVGLSECYRRKNELARAIAILLEAKKKLPDPSYDAQLGFLYRRQGEWVRAADAWQAALAANPKRDDLRLALVHVEERRGRPAEADRLLNQLLKTYPKSPLVHFAQAWLLKSRGDNAGARRAAALVDDLSPTDLVKHYNQRLLQERKP